jgi:hypothetical protein
MKVINIHYQDNSINYNSNKLEYQIIVLFYKEVNFDSYLG